MSTYSDYPIDTSGEDSSSAGEPPDADDQPASNPLDATRALRGRPGGPGLEPNTVSWEAGHSPWQRSQRLWNESGTQWDLPAAAEIPALVPRPRSGAGRGSQPKYQGRHARSRTLPDRSAEPLGAPVLADQDTAADHDLVSWPAPGRRSGTRRRVVTVVLPGAVVVTIGAVAIALLTGSLPRPGHATAANATHKVKTKPQAPRTVGLYSGQQQRGVFQQIDSIAGYGDTIVTTGFQSSDGQVRQQFFVSDDSGSSWRLASVQAAGGGQPSLGHAATLIARGPAGWLAVGPHAIWTSEDGLTWTLAVAHGITPGRSGERVQVLTDTASGFLAGGTVAAPGGGTQGAVWISRDGMSWQRLTAAQLALAPGDTLRAISSAASRGQDTVLSGTVASGATTHAGVWLSTDGGSSWTRVAVPADHGAVGGIVGLGSDAAGFLAVRSGRTNGAADGVAYFSQNGRDWQYAGTIDPAGGWSPSAVKGGSDGFAVTGKTAEGMVVAYTGTGTGTAWTPTGTLGAAASESMLSPAVATDGTVLAAGSTDDSEVGQQGVLLKASRAGTVQTVPLADLPGAVVPELAMNGMAAAGDVQVAVGSADGYPAIWRRQGEGSWTLVSSPALTSVRTSGQDHLAALTGVARGPKGWLAVGVPGPVAFTSADGVTWQPAPGNIAQDLAGASAAEVAAGPGGYVIAGNPAAPGAPDLWWSPDLTSWSQARDLNDVTGSSLVLAVAADAHGFVAVGSHNGKPAAWTTSNGRSWTTIVLPLPAGASSAVLQQIASNGNRMAALGQATTAGGVVPFAALSVDGGATWVQVPFASPGPDTTFTALTANSRGFTAVGQFGPSGQASPAAWTSASGTAWTRTQLSGLTGAYRITALAPAGPAATAIGSIATQQSQGTFIVGVPSR
jgi:hypothetical protein